MGLWGCAADIADACVSVAGFWGECARDTHELIMRLNACIPNAPPAISAEAAMESTAAIARRAASNPPPGDMWAQIHSCYVRAALHISPLVSAPAGTYPLPPAPAAASGADVGPLALRPPDAAWARTDTLALRPPDAA